MSSCRHFKEVFAFFRPVLRVDRLQSAISKDVGAVQPACVPPVYRLISLLNGKARYLGPTHCSSTRNLPEPHADVCK